MARTTKRRRIWIPILCVVLVLALAAGGWFFLGKRPVEPVNVYNFMYVGMTEYWGDSKESYGPVSTDSIQTVFLSSTQTVTEVLVQVGDSVEKGDVLMTFDTTLTDIALERERLKVEKLKLDLEDAQEELRKINAMRPMVVPAPDNTEPPEEDPGVPLAGAYQISSDSTYDGSTQDLALICWIAPTTSIDNSLFATLLAAAAEYQVPETEPVPPETETAPTDPTEETVPEEETVPAEDEPATPTEPVVPEHTPNHVYVVFKITEGNLSNGTAVLWQGMYITKDISTGKYHFQFFDASAFADHTQPEPEVPEPVVPDYGSGYTAAQIAQMRSQQEKTIRDLQFQVKMAETEYKIKQTEISDGNVYAQIDGTVVSLLTPEEALMNQEPFMKVSGGGGFYVEGSVSELDKTNLQIGQEVTVNDWNTGMTYYGTVSKIGDAPLPGDSFYGDGNPNVSYYPFTVYLDGSADLRAGDYVSVLYSTATAENGIYLENPFLRTENGNSYVFVQGEDGLLEKRYITTGKSLWGSYTQILDGLTPEDLIAFPYGKNVKVGVPTVESDPSTLYE